MRRILMMAAALAAVSSWAQGSPAAAQMPEPAAEPGSLASIPSALIGEALTVSITASIGKPEEAPSWEAKSLKYTIPGTAVSVKMLGRDIIILVTVTPYKDKSGGLLLIAQGQVWFKDGDDGLSYRTTVNTLSVNFGERVFFYPFGAHPEVGSPLRVELIMDKYVPTEADTTNQTSQPTSADGTKAKP